jgi:glycerate-2-kinase
MGELNRVLLASGADIEEVNRVRRHVSVCGGGALARATAAKRIEVLAVSDVPGDRVEVIGSGPFARDQGDFVEAGTFLRDRDLFSGLPPNLRAFLDQGPGPVAEAQERSDRHGLDIAHHIVASNGDAVAAALRSCRTRGVAPIPITGAMRGEAGRVGASVGALGRILATRETGADRCCLVLGGETTVTLRGSGQGGRNQELALAAALEIAGHHGVSVLAAGTDGSDGPTDAAGAFADAGTVQRGRARGVDALSALSDNDSYGFFATEGGLLRTGPTGTNVMDLALVLSRRT